MLIDKENFILFFIGTILAAIFSAEKPASRSDGLWLGAIPIIVVAIIWGFLRQMSGWDSFLGQSLIIGILAMYGFGVHWVSRSLLGLERSKGFALLCFIPFLCFIPLLLPAAKAKNVSRKDLASAENNEIRAVVIDEIDHLKGELVLEVRPDLAEIKPILTTLGEDWEQAAKAELERNPNLATEDLIAACEKSMEESFPRRGSELFDAHEKIAFLGSHSQMKLRKAAFMFGSSQSPLEIADRIIQGSEHALR